MQCYCCQIIFRPFKFAWLIIGMAGLAVLVYKIMKQLAIHQNSVRQRKRSVITTILVSAFIGSATIIPLQSEEDRGSEEPVDIQQSYANYGFTYCFTDSLLGQGFKNQRTILKLWCKRRGKNAPRKEGQHKTQHYYGTVRIGI